MADKDQENQEDKSSINIKEEIEKLITDNFEPAKNFEKADLFKSTDDIYYQIQSHIPVEFDKSLIFLVMREQGFKEERQNDLHFVWLLKEK